MKFENRYTLEIKQMNEWKLINQELYTKWFRSKYVEELSEAKYLQLRTLIITDKIS